MKNIGQDKIIKGNSKFSHPQRKSSSSISLKKRKMETKKKQQKKNKFVKGKANSTRNVENYNDIMDRIPSAPFTSNEDLIRKYKTGSTQNVEIYSDDECNNNFEDNFMENIQTRGTMLNIF